MTLASNQPKILSTKPSKGYELLDSGEGEKLERFGEFVLRRPDPQALWNKSLTAEKWGNAEAHFVSSGKSGVWKPKAVLPESWPIELGGLNFGISLSAFKHTGIFPEQLQNWTWIEETLRQAVAKTQKPLSVLNLFGYTGGATLAAAKAGANVTHVDGSKVSVRKASENAKLSGLEKKPIRWIVDDVMAFVKREVKRGVKYDGVIMDPPAYGRGPNKELWEIEKDLPILISECRKLLSAEPLFILLNGYASGYSALAYRNNLDDLMGEKVGDKFGDKTSEIEFGELANESKDGCLLPAGIFARWRRAV